jgi:hypothetical protein
LKALLPLLATMLTVTEAGVGEGLGLGAGVPPLLYPLPPPHAADAITAAEETLARRHFAHIDRNLRSAGEHDRCRRILAEFDTASARALRGR